TPCVCSPITWMTPSCSRPGLITTASPGARPDTPSPSASTVPAPSAPRMRGLGTEGSPCRVHTSRWLSDAARRRISTSPGPATGGGDVRGRTRGKNAVVTTVELARLAEELGIDAIGSAAAAPYTETEARIRERRARGLFADMRFTMAQPEVSCHPEALLDGARTVVSAALCYYAPASA